ncbi:MAG TPA: Smr/MutS family protein [Lacibacter sp.]|nr:Smr/MutS family protein [Lacibacter sp.]HMO89812.1 Smr/MutS family protein [Lacibacter sp.]HMP87758.1 Smr/MutS family protein [Lacibacter sp.]
MKFQIGDKVLLLHSQEEGEVVDIINKEMVMVDVQGVQFPVYTDQLDFPYFKRFTEKKNPAPPPKKYIDQVKQEKQTVKQYNVGEGVWLSFLPVFDKDIFDDDVVDYFRVYLVNNTDAAYAFDYHLSYLHADGFSLTNQILAYNDFYLHDVSFESMNDGPRFDVELRLQPPQKKKAEYYEATFRPKARQLFQRIERLLQNQEATFSYLLMESYPDRVEPEGFNFEKLSAAGFKVYDGKAVHSHLPAARSVIDLHIEKITNNWRGMNNYEILSLQLSEFEKYMDAALHHLQPSLVVIHGVGEGVLKDEIHERLRLRREVKSYVNQYHPLYGYGATEIYFQY